MLQHIRYLALLLALGLVAPWGLAQPGRLDPSFGDGGIVAFDEVFPDLLPQRVSGVDIDEGGRIVAAGHCCGYFAFTATAWRLLDDGTPDPTFDEDGALMMDFMSGRDALSEIIALPSAGTLTTGRYNVPLDSDGTATGFVARLLPDGELDSSFGTSGLVELSAVGLTGAFRPIRVLSDERIVAAGSGIHDDVTGPPCIAARFFPDGSPDSSFGVGGGVAVEPGPNEPDQGLSSYCRAAAFDSSGRIVFGTQLNDAGMIRWSGLRLLVDGSLDPTFEPVADYPGLDQLQGIAVSPDGHYLLAGSNANNDITLVQFMEDGTPDGSFGQGGVAELGFPVSFSPIDLALQPDGKVVVASRDWVARLLADGSLDPAFGEGGVVTLDLPDEAEVVSLSFDAEGRIVVGGVGFIARLLGDGAVSTEPSVQPDRPSLSSPAPNPTAGLTSLTYVLAETANVRLAVYDVLGREVATLAEGARRAGQHDVTLDASRLASGLYVARLQAGSESVTRRLTVVR